MKGQGPKHERETIIRFDEESDQAEVWTASEVTYRRMLKRVGRAYLAEDAGDYDSYSTRRAQV